MYVSQKKKKKQKKQTGIDDANLLYSYCFSPFCFYGFK